ncbi:MAG: twin-arginine translocase TatA/TatE family subunit [Candidatus Sungbacteria bacterium]|uniref:Twin-arginine translocase TatA/TatE family subunit n=1 Tax=Candidatus Sungiibacteriota bacterium TaxID=2750080 RepID=A0A9D6QTN3_9BACT|nr:twin-arginine translocase TatA/TatE family subunit [Candidatus Sungbacteria bacterium]
MFEGIGTKEIIIIAILAIVLFGSRKIPELAKSIVEAIRHMRGAFKDVDEVASGNDKDARKR